jgi:hypothetical protein
LKEKSNNPDFLHIRMAHRPDQFGFQVVLVCTFRISMVSYTVPHLTITVTYFGKKSNNPDFLHIRMAHRPN